MIPHPDGPDRPSGYQTNNKHSHTMKKYLIFAACATLLLASCTKNEIWDNVNKVPEDMPIGFSTYTPRALTKAYTDYYVDGTTVTNLVSGKTFGVYAWATSQTSTTPWTDGTFFAGSAAPNFMSNIPVTFNGATAGADGSANVSAAGLYSAGNPVRYWPSGDKPDGLSFYAYYPAGAAGLTMPANGLGATAFTVQAAAAAQVDFMVAPVVADQWYGHTNSSYSGTVDLTFKHTLTKVRFYFKTDNTDAQTTVTLTNAQLQGVYKTNTLTTSYTAGATANAGTFTYDWGTAETAANFDVTVNGDTPSATNVVLTTTASTCAAADVFLMVPQSIAANTQKITLTWTVTTAGVTTTNTKTIDLYDILDASSAHITWTKNLQVAYTITIGPKPIYFTAAVTPWDTEKTGSIDVN